MEKQIFKIKTDLKENATAPLIHMQERGYTPGTFRHICGAGNNPGKNKGIPQTKSVFMAVLNEYPHKCCATCIKQAIVKGMITVTANSA